MRLTVFRDHRKRLWLPWQMQQARFQPHAVRGGLRRPNHPPW